MNSSAVFGILILFGAIVIMILYMSYKREKEYKLGMEKYERDMEAYRQAVALYGDPSAAAPTPCATVSSADSSAASAAVATASNGEVTLSGVDDRTAAMVIAILCEELGQNPASLRFKSITAL